MCSIVLCSIRKCRRLTASERDTQVRFAFRFTVCFTKNLELPSVGSIGRRVSAFEAIVENDEREIRALVDTWLKATQAGDLETVLHLMSDDVVFLVAGQPPMIGKVAFATAATAQPGGERPRFEGSSEIEELKVLGDWAFMRTKLSVIMTPSGGRSVTRSGYTLSILQKHEGRWLLARDANLLVPVN